MKRGYVSKGFRVDWILHLPEGHCVALGYFLDGSRESNNHNIFRFNAEGEIIWQVERDEQGRRYLGPLASDPTREGRLEGVRDPFMSLSLKYADGSTNVSAQTGVPPALDHWQPGCTVYASSLSGHGYVLDIERGVAVNFSGRKRPW